MFLGKGDLQKHVNTTKHKKNLQEASTSKKVSNFVVYKQTLAGKKILAAEGALAFHIVKHHNSYKSMDCTSSLLKTVFDDSECAKKISCKRTKTESIINGVISPYSLAIILKNLENVPFLGLCTDGSNHGNTKLFPIVIQYFDMPDGIKVRLLDFTNQKDETSATISNMIKDVLNQHNLTSKLVAIVADNTNTNFGGVNRKGEKNVYKILKDSVNAELLGVGCGAHVLHNGIQHGLDQFGLFDVDSIVLKIFNYFSIYTVRTEQLKEFCDFVDITFRQLQNHAKTRWLSLFPAVHRILQMFPALKSYFLSQSAPPKILESFFLSDVGECYFWFVHSLMSLFQDKLGSLQKEKNSVVEVLIIFDEVFEVLEERIKENFLPLKCKTMLLKLKKDAKDKICEDFEARVGIVYKATLDYLRKWTKSYEEFRVFEWLNFKEKIEINYASVENTMIFLTNKNVSFDDSKAFDQFVNLKKFLKQQNSKFFEDLCVSKWCKFFAANVNVASYSELLKIAQFFFAIPAHNANCERVFSLMNSQWTDERNRLSVESMKHILSVQFNFSHLSCEMFYEHLLLTENDSLLRKIGESEKYCKP